MNNIQRYADDADIKIRPGITSVSKAVVERIKAATWDEINTVDDMDFDALNSLGINKAIVEFLRVNTWIKKWFTGIDYKPYKLKQGSYRFLRLNDKKRIISKINIPQISVCEDYQPHWKYWQVNVNPNRDDCCNLRRA